MTEQVKNAVNTVATILNINAFGSLNRGWPQFWDRLTRTARTFVDTIAEFFDNAAAEMKDHGPITVTVEIGGDWTASTLNLDTAWMRVRDNGPGMPLERLEKCLALAELAREKADSLHEHGVGMKAALVMFSSSVESVKHIATRRAGDAHGYRFSYYDAEHPFGEIPILYDDEIFGPEEHGTEFYIVGLSDKGVYKRRQDYTMHVINQLGFKYARLLAGETFHGNNITIQFRLCNKDGSPIIDKDGKVEYAWTIKPVVQRYRNAERPTIDNEKLTKDPEGDDEGYAVFLTFGLAAQEEEYLAAGLVPPDTKHPCHQYRRQIHIVAHGKVITSLDIDDFGGNKASNSYVPYTGTITLVHGFSTTFEKNGIVNNSNWQHLRDRVFAKIDPLIRKWAAEYPKEQLEKNQLERKIRDAYAARLRIPQPGSDRNPVAFTEYSVEGTSGRIDIFFKTDKKDEKGLVIEIKPDVADGQDVMQAYNYVFMAETAIQDRCQLVALDFTTGAQVTADKVSKKLGVKVDLIKLESLRLEGIDAHRIAHKKNKTAIKKLGPVRS